MFKKKEKRERNKRKRQIHPILRKRSFTGNSHSSLNSESASIQHESPWSTGEKNLTSNLTDRLIHWRIIMFIADNINNKKPYLGITGTSYCTAQKRGSRQSWWDAAWSRETGLKPWPSRCEEQQDTVYRHVNGTARKNGDGVLPQKAGRCARRGGLATARHAEALGAGRPCPAPCRPAPHRPSPARGAAAALLREPPRDLPSVDSAAVSTVGAAAPPRARRSASSRGRGRPEPPPSPGHVTGSRRSSRRAVERAAPAAAMAARLFPAVKWVPAPALPCPESSARVLALPPHAPPGPRPLCCRGSPRPRAECFLRLSRACFRGPVRPCRRPALQRCALDLVCPRARLGPSLCVSKSLAGFWRFSRGGHEYVN